MPLCQLGLEIQARPQRWELLCHGLPGQLRPSKSKRLGGRLKFDCREHHCHPGRSNIRKLRESEQWFAETQSLVAESIRKAV